MTTVQLAGTRQLGDKQVFRMGYGAMQLAGPGVFGPPDNPEQAIEVLRLAIEQGINHIDTSDFYGPHITNQLIRQALHPYKKELCLVTKVSARRDDKGNWIPAMSESELIRAVEENLENLGLDQLDVVNLRSMYDVHKPAEGSLEGPLTTLLNLQSRGLIRHIGLSNVTPTQIKEALALTPVACVQNYYNLAERSDDALIDWLEQRNIPYVPYFPLGGFTPLQSDELSAVASELSASPMQVALAWLLQRSPNILLIPGTSKPAHLLANIDAAKLQLPQAYIERLNAL
ncbi:oxidoreductase [Mangrovibacter phragmitis]|uniref:oxidoreductase n=1 Tax=Mangrovibacter phragmitis TaxID=1691903 RepID=UPI0035132EAF